MILIIKHVINEGPGLISDILTKKGFSIHTIELSRGEKLPQNIDNLEAVIILGGPMNVNEENKYTFLKDENFFIKQILKDEIPFMGICLGAQLLAKAAGSKVLRAKNPELGWNTVHLTQYGINDPLFNNCDPNMTVFQWHEDTFEISENGILLAENENCFQAFRIGVNAYGLQFHFEATPPMIYDWLNQITMPESEKIRMFEHTLEISKNYSQQASVLCSNFINTITAKSSL